MLDLDHTFRWHTAPGALPDLPAGSWGAAKAAVLYDACSLGTNAIPHLTIMKNEPLAASPRVGEVRDLMDQVIDHPPLPETMAFLQSTH